MSQELKDQVLIQQWDLWARECKRMMESVYSFREPRCIEPKRELVEYDSSVQHNTDVKTNKDYVYGLSLSI